MSKQGSEVPWYGKEKISLALIASMLIQASSCIWWGATVNAKTVEYDRHFVAVDEFNKKTDETKQQIIERLTRLEEQQKSSQGSLDRIEMKLDGSSGTTPGRGHR